MLELAPLVALPLTTSCGLVKVNSSYFATPFSRHSIFSVGPCSAGFFVRPRTRELRYPRSKVKDSSYICCAFQSFRFQQKRKRGKSCHQGKSDLRLHASSKAFELLDTVVHSLTSMKTLLEQTTFYSLSIK